MKSLGWTTSVLLLSVGCQAESPPNVAPSGANTEQAVQHAMSGAGGSGQPSLSRPFMRPPAPSQPAPGQPAPGQPAPGQPAPGQPAPGQPAPGQPAPGQPAPSSPTAMESGVVQGLGAADQRYFSARPGVRVGNALQAEGDRPPPPPVPYSELKEIPYYPKPEPPETPAAVRALKLGMVDVTAEAGLGGGPRGLQGALPRLPVQSILYTSGQGVAWLDVNGDDWPDLLTLLDQPVLYRNLQNGRFERMPRAFPTLPAVRARGIATGDVEGDGDIDLYLSAYRGGVLLLNDGDGRFQDATARWGLTPQVFGMSSSLADLDQDGRLDLIIGNYLEFEEGKNILCDVQGKKEDCGPHYYPPARPTVWKNRGDRFENVTEAWNFGSAHGRTLGVLARDLDGDGRLEVLLANDMTPGDLLVASCPKGLTCDETTLAPAGAPERRSFENRGMLSGLAYDSRGQVHAGMGVELADTDRDGRLDVVIAAFFQEGTSLYRAVNPLQYRDISWLQGLGPLTWPSLGFGVTFLDVDRNGEQDLFQANGHVLQYAETFLPGSTYEQSPQLLYNQGGHFWDVSDKLTGGAGTPQVARGLARADFDRDGRVDVAFSTLHGGVRLLRNVSEGGQAVALRLQRASGQDAQGAFYRVQVGGAWRVGSFGVDGSYLSAHEPWVQVGLGQATQLDAVEVVWSPGRKERFGPSKAGARVTLREGKGERL